jgi:hypothetical protein
MKMAIVGRDIFQIASKGRRCPSQQPAGGARGYAGAGIGRDGQALLLR